MRNENPSWGEQSQPTIWDTTSSGHSTPVVPSVESRGETILAGSLVGASGHLAVIAAGAKLAGDNESIIRSIN